MRENRLLERCESQVNHVAYFTDSARLSKDTGEWIFLMYLYTITE